MPVALVSSDLFPSKHFTREGSDFGVILSTARKPYTWSRTKSLRHFCRSNSSTNKMSSTLSLRNFLKKKSQTSTFRAFLQKEFSEENLDFWTEVEAYKKRKASKQCKLAEKIYKTYIAMDAPREINIDHFTRTTTKNNMKHPDSNTFDLAHERIFLLMEKDSFRRFLLNESNELVDMKKTTRNCNILKSVLSDKLKLSAKFVTNNVNALRQESACLLG